MIQTKIIIIAIMILLVSFVRADGNMAYDTPPVVNAAADTYEISYEELYAVFTLTMDTWQNGEKVRVIMMSENAFAHKYFIENYLGIGRAAYNRRLENAISSGRGSPPIIVDGNLEMIDKLKSTEGAIGYLDGTFYVSPKEGEAIILIRVK